MLAKIFLKLTDYPFFRRLIWKPVYELLSKKFKVKDWSFMNYGYTPFKSEPFLILDNSEEINRYPIQLYHYLASKINVTGVDLLEVGSGRGGGLGYIKKYLHPKKLAGVDIAFSAIKIAREQIGQGIEFIQGSAEKLPLTDETFDVVINIESSHAYGSVPAFLSEVKRVLRPGGYLLCADIRTADGMETLQQDLLASGMQLVSEEDISNNVKQAIELEEPIKQKRIRENIPGWMQEIFKEFAGVVGSKAHVQLQSGELVYKRFVLKK
ncbi:MAG: class SAM-dependent methyltransferase [Segetibacter sp.]|nr:class SAM-dependent methyltransferase [Segetibacter sp.]